MPPSKDTALSLFRQGRWAEADQALSACLPAAPRDADLLRALAQLRFMAQRLPEALDLMDRVIALDPRDAAALNSKGAILTATGRFAEAVTAYDAALALDPTLVRAHANRAVALAAIGRPAEALRSAEAALAQDSGNPGALASQGMALLALQRAADAVPALDRAIAADPGNVAARLDLAEALVQTSAFDRAWDVLAPLRAGPPLRQLRWIQARALMGRGDFPAAQAEFTAMEAADPGDADAVIGVGNTLSLQAKHEDALAAFDRAAALRPGDAMVHNNRGNALSALGRHNEAHEAFRTALRCDPDLQDAHINMGMTLLSLDRQADSAAAFERAIALGPVPHQAHLILATLLLELKKPAEAVAKLTAELQQNPQAPSTRVLLMGALREACDWHVERRLLPGLAADAVADPHHIDPLRLMWLVDSPEAHRAVNSAIVETYHPARPALWRGERYGHDRIRIGYFSADHKDHAVSQLAVGVYEHHDRARFETYAIALGPKAPDGDSMMPRLMRAFDHFIPTTDMDDDALARLVRELEIDVLVEMNGFTKGGRLSVLAQRPAPVQAAWLGFPGTMGAEYCDYIVADPVVIPEAEEPHYVEAVARLPDCYLPADNRRSVGVAANRTAAGLPPQGFVFAGFNGRQKIGADVFDVWMRIVSAVPGSLLWLSNVAPDAQANLRGEAEARGVEARRLVFAPHVPMPLHLARQRWADLLLDALPYNAHTTASDALWGGAPVLTLPGRSMQSRCAASLLTSIGMPELIAPDLPAFEAMAIDLARNPDRLAALRDKLAVQRRTSPVFDTERYCRHLEDAFATMHDRAMRGLKPASFTVPRRPPG